MATAETTLPQSDALAKEWRRAEEARGGSLSTLAFTAAAFAAELLILLAAERGRLPLIVALALHVLVSAGLGHLVIRRMRAGADTIPSLLAALLTTLAGPLGAGMAIAGILLSQRSRSRPELLTAWYDRISLSQETDPEQQLCDRVAIGRTIDLGAPPPRSFAETVLNGTLAERQTALGLIARNFSPDYAPALRAALKSEEPIIRVQAAAVAARVREGLEKRVVELVRRADAGRLKPVEALALTADIMACAETGLLDDSTVRRAAGAAVVLRRNAIPDAPAGALELLPLLRGRHCDDDVARRRIVRAVEAELIARSDFSRFRAVRRLTRTIDPAGAYRVRGRMQDARAGRGREGAP